MGAKIGVLLNCGQQSQFSKVRREFDAGRVNLDPPMTCADWPVGETGYGCHTFYITDVFRNIVIIADIRLLLCLNIVSCAHINMQFVIFTS